MLTINCRLQLFRYLHASGPNIIGNALVDMSTGGNPIVFYASQALSVSKVSAGSNKVATYEAKSLSSYFGQLDFNASNYDARYSSNKLQVSALQCLACIRA